ncbi:MAG: hypothetical protein IPM04_03660 [Saprospiraceae bacterium]|nr:hypothetical protein [Candidatus Brachybacter algidus]MBK8746968.1 hypothetical protein [Candidatus Brachybacter algidus]
MPILNGVSEVSSNTSMNSANVGITNAVVDSLDGNYNLSATIFCDTLGNNDAQNVEVLVLLPAEVNIIKYKGPDSCLIMSNNTTYTNRNIKAGYLKFGKRSMSRYESFDIKLTTSKSVKPVASRPNFAIFVHNQSPEIIYKDNFWTSK